MSRVRKYKESINCRSILIRMKRGFNYEFFCSLYYSCFWYDVSLQYELIFYWYLDVMNPRMDHVIWFYVVNLIFWVSLRLIYACLFLIKLIRVSIFNSCLVLYCEIEKSIIWIDRHKWNELHAILEIGRHKSFGLESNLIREFTELVMQL